MGSGISNTNQYFSPESFSREALNERSFLSPLLFSHQGTRGRTIRIASPVRAVLLFVLLSVLATGH